MTPGIQPQRVRIRTINTEPQPLSITASGGKMMERITRNTDMFNAFESVDDECNDLLIPDRRPDHGSAVPYPSAVR